MEAICLHVQAVLEDWMAQQQWQQAHAAHGDGECACGAPPVQRAQNLLINVPPGTSKSRIVAVCAVAWMWTRWPSWRVNCLSSNPRVAERDGDYCLTLIQSEWYRDTFRREWRLDPQQCCKTHFANSAQGFRKAFGWNSKITGDRGDCIIVDDPHDAEEANSDLIREGVIARWDNAISNRVNDLRSSVRIGVMQRVHEADWTAHVLAQGGWDHLCIPMEWEPQRLGAAKDAIPQRTAAGWRDPRTEPGELMDPVRFPEAVLALERRKGARRYAGQYQQRPAPADGTIFKGSWFAGTYRRLPPLREVWSCWDTALKAQQRNDETACVVMGLGEDGFLYVLRVTHGRWETPDVAKFLIQQAYWLRGLYGDAYRGDYVEDKVSGTTLLQYVRRHTDGDRERAQDGCRLALIPVQVEQDKEARAHGVAPLCEAGRVLVPDLSLYPQAHAWLEALLAQLLTFPGAAHDDLVDAFVYCLKRHMGTLGRRKSARGGGGQV